MYSHFAFISEAGNTGFDFENEATSNYFIVSAILIENKNMDSIHRKLAKLDLVSEEITWTDERVNELIALEFQLYAVVINKKKLQKDGRHGRLELSFEFMNELIFKDLFATHLNVLVHADYREKPFIKSFTTYLNKHLQPDFFNRTELVYEQEEKSGPIQLTNVISKLILDAYEQDQSLLNKLSPKLIHLEKHPTFDYNLQIDNELDHVIATQSISVAESYIKKYKNSETQINIDWVNFLKFLLTQLSMKPNRYINGQEVVENLNVFSADRISTDFLRRRIIGPLRDRGVLIASTLEGYKIPTSSKDLTDFVDFSSSMALPMLQRIKKGRDRVLEVTNGKVDIIEGEQFSELRDFFSGRVEV